MLQFGHRSTQTRTLIGVLLLLHASASLCFACDTNHAADSSPIRTLDPHHEIGRDPRANASTVAAHVAQKTDAWRDSLPQPTSGTFAAFCGPQIEGVTCIRGGWFERGVDINSDGCHQMGDPADAELSATPAGRIWVDTFYIDQKEVTNADYAGCVQDGVCRDVSALYRDFDRDAQPHTGGSWFDAMAFCQWRGMTLPTEAQFELAARGKNGTRTPFGNDLVTCDNAVIENKDGRSCGVTKRGSHPEKGRVFEVASRPAGHFGIYDLVGNAEEWVLDWWTPSWEACGDSCAGLNPRGPCDGARDCDGHRFRAVRGGSWYWGPECATGYHRRRYQPSNDPPHHFGFRCAVAADTIKDADE